MGVSREYSRGYTAGYNYGMQIGKQKAGDTVIKNDLKYVYGMMCIKLFEKGWTTEEIKEFCLNIQSGWCEEYNLQNKEMEEGRQVEKMTDKVERITGVSLTQTFSGMDDKE